MSAPPYMPFYFGDYARDTGHLTRGEHGAYFLLLKAMWTSGGKLPADDKKLARLALCTPEEWVEVREVVLPYFKRRGGVLRHKRIDVEVAKYANTSGKRSEAGRKGGRQTANKNKHVAQTNAVAGPQQPEPEPEGIGGLLHSPTYTFRTDDAARHDGATTPALRVVEKEPLEVRKAVVASIGRGLPKIVRDPPSETPAQMAERVRKATA